MGIMPPDMRLTTPLTVGGSVLQGGQLVPKARIRQSNDAALGQMKRSLSFLNGCQ